MQEMHIAAAAAAAALLSDIVYHENPAFVAFSF